MSGLYDAVGVTDLRVCDLVEQSELGEQLLGAWGLVTV